MIEPSEVYHCSFTKQIINSTCIYTEELSDLLKSYSNFPLVDAKGKKIYLR